MAVINRLAEGASPHEVLSGCPILEIRRDTAWHRCGRAIRADGLGRPSQLGCVGQHAFRNPWTKPRLCDNVNVMAEQVPKVHQ